MPSRPSGRDRQAARIDNLTVPAFDGRGPIECDFTFVARGARVASLDAALTTALGIVRQLIPAAVAGMEGARGGGRLALDLAALPAGPCELTLAIVDEDGRRGPPASAAFEVTGGGGVGPVMLAVEAVVRTDHAAPRGGRRARPAGRRGQGRRARDHGCMGVCARARRKRDSLGRSVCRRRPRWPARSGTRRLPVG